MLGVGIFINKRLATEEEQEMIMTSLAKEVFDSMTEQEKKDMADRFYEAIKKQIRKDDKNV